MSGGRSDNGEFKRCSACSQVWQGRDDFFSDPEVALVGYQALGPDPEEGMLLFNHLGGCGTTMGMWVSKFEDMWSGTRHAELLRHSDACERHCYHTNDLERCSNSCSGAWVREVLQVVRHWPKDGS